MNTTKQISNSSNRPSIAYLWQMKMELIFKIIIAFIFNPPSGHFIFIAGKGDWEDGSNNITCICVRKPLLMYLLLSPDCCPDCCLLVFPVIASLQKVIQWKSIEVTQTLRNHCQSRRKNEESFEAKRGDVNIFLRC